jgi:hypothetical protein
MKLKKINLKKQKNNISEQNYKNIINIALLKLNNQA